MTRKRYNRDDSDPRDGIDDIEEQLAEEAAADEDRVAKIVGMCSPFIIEARRRFEEGADVPTVARALGIPVEIASQLFLVHERWRHSQNSPTLAGVKAALVFKRIKNGRTVEQIAYELGLSLADVGKLRADYDKLAALNPFVPDEDRPHRLGDVHHWLSERKAGGGTHVLLMRKCGAFVGCERKIVFYNEAENDADVVDGARVVMSLVGTQPGSWWLEAYAGARTPSHTVMLLEEPSVRGNN